MADGRAGGQGGGISSRRCRPVSVVPGSVFKGFRFPPEMIVVAVRWYLRYGLSYRDVEELLAERGVEVDHVTVFRWVQRFTPLLADAAGLPPRPRRQLVRRRDIREGCGPLAVRVPGRRPARAGHRRARLSPARRRRSAPVLRTALGHGEPVEVVTDRAPALPRGDRGADPCRVFTTPSSMRTIGSKPTTDSSSTAPTDARTRTRSHRRRDHPRARVHAEPPTWPLRTRRRSPTPPPCRGCVHRSRPSHLTGHGTTARSLAARSNSTQESPSALPAAVGSG